ncbi:MAG: sigma-70 family RNA polymerase sigma factor [Cytophagaceae bacterium]|nr:sigma-70 family RNA polymerase sigma factor [Cytophagaceae bacterium]
MEDSESLPRYFKEIRKIKPLSSEEELLLIEKIRSGDNISKERLIKANLRFVVAQARKYNGKGLDIADLINEGNLGLLYSIRKYNKDKKVRFLTYAGFWIRKFIRKAIYAKGRTIHLPHNKNELLQKLELAERTLEDRLGRIPYPEELAVFLDIPEEDILDLLKFKLSETPVSLDSSFTSKDKEELPLLEVLADLESKSGEELLIEKDRKETFEKLLTQLTEKQGIVIRLYFGFEGESLNLEEISDRLNISAERARQLRDAGLKKLGSLLRP